MPPPPGSPGLWPATHPATTAPQSHRRPNCPPADGSPPAQRPWPPPHPQHCRPTATAPRLPPRPAPPGPPRCRPWRAPDESAPALLASCWWLRSQGRRKRVELQELGEWPELRVRLERWQRQRQTLPPARPVPDRPTQRSAPSPERDGTPSFAAHGARSSQAACRGGCTGGVGLRNYCAQSHPRWGQGHGSGQLIVVSRLNAFDAGWVAQQATDPPHPRGSVTLSPCAALFTDNPVTTQNHGRRPAGCVLLAMS